MYFCYDLCYFLSSINFELFILFLIPSLVAQTVKCLPTMPETQVQFLSWEDPLEKEVGTHSSILAWRFHGQRSLVGCSPWDRKELNKAE